MPHDRGDQRELFGGTRDPIVQRPRATSDRQRERQASPPTAKPEQEFFLGRNKLSPLEIFLQQKRTTGRRGPLGEIFEFAKASAQAVGEFGSEAADVLTGRTAETERDFFDAILPGTEEVAPALEGFVEEHRAGPLLGTFGFAEIEDATNQEIEELAPEPLDRDAIASRAQQIQENKAKLEDVDRILGEQDLDPTEEFAVAQIRERLEISLAELEVELLELNDQLSIQDVIFDIAARDSGLADSLDLADLEKALGADGGLGHQTYQAILDLANDAALSEKERDEAIDIVLARQHFSQEIVKTINDLVKNKADLIELQGRSDWELLNDPAAFLSPTVNFDVTGVDDADRFLNDMYNSVDNFLNTEVPVTIPNDHPSFQVFDQTVLLVMQFGMDNPDVQQNITDLASVWELDETALAQTFDAARTQAEDNNKQWNEALDADEARPGSGVLVAALWQAGEEIGFTPAQLEMAAKSQALHALIETKSGGVSGQISDGTIAGMGGLTLEMYEDLMPQPWTPTSGMRYELIALLRYIDEFFQGDALKALTFYFDSGEWGGTESMPDG